MQFIIGFTADSIDAIYTIFCCLQHDCAAIRYVNTDIWHTHDGFISRILCQINVIHAAALHLLNPSDRICCDPITPGIFFINVTADGIYICLWDSALVHQQGEPVMAQLMCREASRSCFFEVYLLLCRDQVRFITACQLQNSAQQIGQSL